jgi:hypothetical protein
MLGGPLDAEFRTTTITSTSTLRSAGWDDMSADVSVKKSARFGRRAAHRYEHIPLTHVQLSGCANRLTDRLVRRVGPVDLQVPAGHRSRQCRDQCVGVGLPRDDREPSRGSQRGLSAARDAARGRLDVSQPRTRTARQRVSSPARCVRSSSRFVGYVWVARRIPKLPGSLPTSANPMGASARARRCADLRHRRV